MQLHSVVSSERDRSGVDALTVITFSALVFIGLLILFSASYYNAQDAKESAFSVIFKQLIGIALGIVALVIMSRVDYQLLKRREIVAFSIIVSAALLIAVSIPGIGHMINGSRRWLYIGPISFQPSELAKVSSVLFLARSLSQREQLLGRFFAGLVPVLIVPGVFFILILRQPNLSTAGSIIIVAIIMLMAAGAKWRHLTLLGMLGGVVGAWYAWSEPYRRARLLSFRDPFASITNEGYQLAQSLLAFGSGGWFGMGLGRGRQKFAFLPYPESDFIFAVVGEDLGFVGCVAIIGLFMLFIYAGMRVALNCPDRFGSLLACGITCMIGVQVALNIAVVIGLAPTTGLPLPFFSMGGTSVSIFMAAVGVLLNISRHSQAF